MDILTLSPYTLATIPVVIALSTVARLVGLPVRYSPVADLIFGIALMALFAAGSWAVVILQGLLLGLIAAGLYNAPQVVAGTLTSDTTGAAKFGL